MLDRHTAFAYSGALHEHVLFSPALQDNPLGDPAARTLVVYTPPGYDDNPTRHYPSIYVIQGYTGQVSMWWNRTPFKEPYPKVVDDLFASDHVPPCLVVYVDAWTRYGGSQYVDSAGTGKYHTYLCQDVVPFVDAHYRTIDHASQRGIQGKSSGGFGAMITPMLRPDLFGGLATHAGDTLYELCYGNEFGKATRLLRNWNGSPEDWWADFTSRAAFTNPADMTLLGLYGVAACFSPDERGRPLLPFNTTSGRILEEVWARWLAWDPVRMVPAHQDALRGLRAIWVDAGRNDEYFLDLGAQAFVDELASIGIHDVHFELFEGGHGGIDHRYPRSLAFLAKRLQP
ncbi:MAG: alpha/beta hydrolase [Ferrimicrobium sp.]|jgi:S-formylglutathione hydrolase FrmB|uniref:Alpha/beta hydrolase-fold protein n=1 Tax=Ferrimicrobium acidiphilum TaxID=121039 RepID=A0ABV3Y423_9ACTN|nr:alpha/beta hydrolase-fold protein [Ferrimicrobium sp.]MCL5974101.1 alpha/beta hydrolase-fold protein [Actinomycetota bacterium]